MTSMRPRMSKAAWAVPAAVALAIGAIAAAPQLSQAATPDLPQISAQELLTKIASAGPQALSGTVEVTSDFGIPDLSSLSALGGAQSASPLSLLSGTTTLQVWEEPGTGSRANIEGRTSAYSVVATKGSVWTYSSSEKKAVHLVIPASLQEEAKAKAAEAHEKAGKMPTPSEVATEVLKEIDPSTTLAIDTTASVAGRDCYQIVATPKDSGSLVASVRLAVDAKTFSPLRAEVYSTSSSAKPALKSAFTKVSYAKPAASIFTFTPPKGTETQTITAQAPEGDAKHEMPEPDVTVTGKGWASVLEVSNAGELMSQFADAHSSDATEEATSEPSLAQQKAAKMFGHGADGAGESPDLSQALAQLAKNVDGGTLYQTSLFSVLITDDGKVYAGAVPGATLEAAAK